MAPTPVQVLDQPRLKVGDVVQLKSEHCRMTVVQVEGNIAHCAYMTQNLFVVREPFPFSCLLKVQHDPN